MDNSIECPNVDQMYGYLIHHYDDFAQDERILDALLGFNYLLTYLQCALGLLQLQRAGADSSWHLYLLGFRSIDRGKVFNALR